MILGRVFSLVVILSAHFATDLFGRTTTVCFWAYIRLCSDECLPVSFVYKCGNGARIDTGYWYSSSVL